MQETVEQNLDSSSTSRNINSTNNICNNSSRNTKKSDTHDTKDNSPMIKGDDIMSSENAKHVFNHDKCNYKSSAHLEHFRKLMIACGLDPQYADSSANQKSKEEDYSLDSTSSSCGSSSSSSSSSSCVFGSDGSNPMPVCPAGTMRSAPFDAILANSTHTCRGCSKKIHSALHCGSSCSDLINKNPSVVGIKLTNEHIIEQDNNN